MTVLLNRAYGGFAKGTVTVFDKPTEDSLVAQGLASVSALAPTTGPTAPQAMKQGRGAIAIGASSLVVNHPECTAQSVVMASVSQAAADATLLRVERIVASDGFFTIYGTANATAVVPVSWILFNVVGSLRN